MSLVSIPRHCARLLERFLESHVNQVPGLAEHANEFKHYFEWYFHAELIKIEFEGGGISISIKVSRTWSEPGMTLCVKAFKEAYNTIARHRELSLSTDEAGEIFERFVQENCNSYNECRVVI